MKVSVKHIFHYFVGNLLAGKTDWVFVETKRGTIETISARTSLLPSISQIVIFKLISLGRSWAQSPHIPHLEVRGRVLELVSLLLTLRRIRKFQNFIFKSNIWLRSCYRVSGVSLFVRNFQNKIQNMVILARNFIFLWQFKT